MYLRFHPLVHTILLCITMLLQEPSPAHAGHLLKLATLAPEGSIWVEHFRDFAEEVNEKTGGEVTIRIYPGGAMGDDLAMYRKIRAGQLQGGGFTMTGIAPVVPDFNIMAIPCYFDNYDQVDAAIARMRPFFSQKFAEKDLEFVALTEVGFAYAMSTEPTSSIEELRRRKSWIPTGDPLTATFLKNLDVNPIPLSIPDVLSSLQTGLVDTVYVSLYGAIVMQWFTKARYVADFPFGYAYGAVAFSSKAFSRLPEEYGAIIREAAGSHFSALNRETRRTNDESRQVLEDNGVVFVEPQPATHERLAATREKSIAELTGSAFSREAFALLSRTNEEDGQTDGDIQ